MRLLDLVVLLVFFIEFSLCQNKVQNKLSQYNIITNITKDYNKIVRPDDQVKISIKFSVKQIVSFDEKNQIMTSNSFLSLIWTDNRLDWNPTDYDDAENILISSNSIWMPDIFIINTAETNGYVPIPTSSLARVNNLGRVYVLFSLTSLKTRCKMSVKYYPFDTQNCSIVIGSWMHDRETIDFTESEDGIEIDDSSYINHPIWNLNTINVTSINSDERLGTFLTDEKDTFSEDISIQFVLKRRPLYFMINNIFPCLVLNCVTLLAFTLPFGSQIGLSKLLFKILIVDICGPI